MKMNYTKKPQLKYHKSCGMGWTWFRDTILGKDIVVVRDVPGYDAVDKFIAREVDGYEVDQSLGPFEGLHCCIGGDGPYKGSIIFLSRNSLSVLAHEVVHAATRALGWAGIDNEEALATTVSSWMELTSKALKIRGQ